MVRLREHDRDQIAEDLIEWAQKEDSINLCGFCAQKLLVPSKLSQWAKEDDSFRQAYDLAKTFLGNRRERMLNNEQLHVKAYDLNAKTYDYFLKEESREEKKFDSELAAKIVDQASEQQAQKMDDILDQLRSLQSADLNNADTSNNADAKSQ